MSRINGNPSPRTGQEPRRRAVVVGARVFLLLLAGSLLSPLLAEEPAAFRTSILPVLTKAGCNSGACHGAATGQGGFKLSLLGYDPEEDHERITRELGGRRLDLAEPEESLFLRKPARQLPHEGGRRLPRDSEGYSRLLKWINQGAPYGPAELAVSSVAVTPADRLVPSTNRTFSLRVLATLSDGTREDVTPLALYTSNDDAIAEVNKSGEVTTRGRGITSIMVRYAGQVATARIAVPFALGATNHPNARPFHPIDLYVQDELARLGLPASPVSEDAEFLRRVYLDLTGRLPSSEQVRQFLNESSSMGKRQRLIEELLASEEFVDFWTMHWADLLLIGGKPGNEAAVKTYHDWLRGQVADNVPFDRMARSLITAAGEIATVGPASFYLLASDPRDVAEHVGRIFLGTQIGCARCHAHPADRWTQEDYYQFAAFFARVGREGNAIQVTAKGEVDHPKTRRPVLPKALGANGTGVPDSEDRRIQLADWLTAPDNPLFARTIVNRVWKHLLGRGLVEPVDDLRSTNPATHPALLDALAGDFVKSGYDIRRLIQTIASSDTYQRSSRAWDLNRRDDRFYSHALLKPLPSQVFVDAVAQLTGVPEQFEGYPEGTRAVQLVGARVNSYALDVLGRCARDRACDTPVSSGGGLSQALHLINGTTINDRLATGNLTAWLAQGWTDHQIVEEIYLRAFSRLPESHERTEWEQWLSTAASRKEALEDLLWTVLNSREFAFNH